jgi:hypothetical protein
VGGSRCMYFDSVYVVYYMTSTIGRRAPHLWKGSNFQTMTQHTFCLCHPALQLHNRDIPRQSLCWITCSDSLLCSLPFDWLTTAHLLIDCMSSKIDLPGRPYTQFMFCVMYFTTDIQISPHSPYDYLIPLCAIL